MLTQLILLYNIMNNESPNFKFIMILSSRVSLQISIDLKTQQNSYQKDTDKIDQ